MAEFGYLTLQELAEQYGLLSKSPSYSRVQQARQRLAALRESLQQYDEMEADYSEVLEYAEMLQRNGQAVGQALCLARSFVPFSRSPDPAQKMRDGLMAIGSALGLVTAGEEFTRTELNRCFIEAFGADAELPEIAREANWEAAWTKKYFTVRKKAAELSAATIVDVRKAAWNVWETRLLAFLQKQTQTPPVPVDLNYLRCLTERSAPGTLLPLNLAEATVGRWSDAMLAAARAQREDAPEYCPTWIALYALRGLGFELGTDWEFAAPVWPLSEMETIRRILPVLSTANNTTPPALLVLRIGAGTITSNWLPSTVPCLSLDAAGWEIVMGRGRLFLDYLEKRIGCVLFEITGPDEVSKAMTLWNALPNPLRSKMVAAVTSSKVSLGPTVGPGWSVLSAPDNATEAWEQAFARLQNASAPRDLRQSRNVDLPA